VHHGVKWPIANLYYLKPIDDDDDDETSTFFKNILSDFSPKALNHA
jgi:hypothetical protein